MNKIAEEKTEGLKDDDSEKNQEQLSLATQAYKLFSEGNTPLEVAIELNLRESEASQLT